MISWLNGEFGEQLSLPATNAGSLLGWGVFTTLGIWNARPFAFDKHLTRLKHDAVRGQIEYSIDDETLESALRELISFHNIKRGMARITVTRRGDGRWNTENGSDVSIIVRQLKDEIAPASITVSPLRVHSGRALSGVKSTSYLDYQLAWQEAQSRGYDEAILINQDGFICEGARSNVFWTQEGELFTPALSTGCLPGIARRFVLDWSQEEGIATHEIELPAADFCDTDNMAADGVFLTSAASGVRTVATFEGRRLMSNGVITRLQERWSQAVKSHGI